VNREPHTLRALRAAFTLTPMSAPSANQLLTCDGDTLLCRHWPAVAPTAASSVGATLGREPRTWLLVHGLGEHSGRYLALAEWLQSRGDTVHAYDQRGHGLSSAPRGHIARPQQLVEQLVEVVEGLATPIYLLGHSLGGLVAASAVSRGLIEPRALVLSSPALALPLRTWQKWAVALLPHVAPNLILGNGLDAEQLSHDSKVVEAYRTDPLVHDRISARLGQFLATEGEYVRSQAPNWKTPTLLLYAGADRLVDPAGSRAFYSRANSDYVKAQEFTDLRHEIFNELARDNVLRALEDWLAVVD
jgi:alpha-beta hydrolase superfamily lysophospholipase